jgi:serine/threonine protein kinase
MQSLSPDLRDLLAQLLRKQPSERITLEDALDHDWMQLVDEAAEMEAKQSGADAKASDFAPGKSLRARAYSFRRVHVTEDDINGAIRSVNNFVLVVSESRGEGLARFSGGPHVPISLTDIPTLAWQSKLKRRLTQKLQEARASLSRTRSPSTTPEGSRAATPNAGSKPPTPQSRAATPQSRVLTPQSRAAGSSPTPVSRASPQPQPRHSPRPSASIDEAVVRENSADFGSAVATPRSRLDGTPGSRTLRKRRSCAVM